MRRLAPVLHAMGRLHTEVSERNDAELLDAFARRGDEGAFATLLRRHGPMVLAVCRRTLRDRHEAEDAFQATFLLLVRKARSLRQPARLGAWLHGVAYRTALKAKAAAARRAAVGGVIGDVAAVPDDGVLWRDLRPVLDEAIHRLPSKYRVPFVLCHLQGMTQAEAARRLGCPEGTVATRLARARGRLRIRLAKLAPGAAAGLAAAGLGDGIAIATPPTLLIASTLRIAAAFRADPAGSAPAHVVALTEGVCRAMFLTKLRTVLLIIGFAGAVLGGTAVWAVGGPGPRPEPAVAAPAQFAPPIAPPAAPPVPVLDKAATPAVFHTDNFEVHAPSRRIAQLVADAAERLRKREAVRWLGKELPRWPNRCVVTVSDGDGHATTFTFEAGKVKSRSMVLAGPLDQVLSNGLPHEITHTVLADTFGAPVPRWADEGAALLAEDDEEQQRRQTLVHELIDEPNRLIPLNLLLAAPNYPKDVAAFYAESYALTRFLIERKDRKTFLAFVGQGMTEDGWDRAVKTHSGLDDVAALKKAWLAKVRTAAVAQPKTTEAREERTTIRSQPPVFGRAVVDKKGQLILRRPVVYYQPITRFIRPGKDAPLAPVTSYELRITQQVTFHNAQDVPVMELDGKRIEPKALMKRLQSEVPVLIAPNGRPVDPYYLGAIKEGTIILIPRVDPDRPVLPSAFAEPPAPPLTPPTPLTPPAPR